MSKRKTHIFLYDRVYRSIFKNADLMHINFYFNYAYVYYLVFYMYIYVM